MPLYDYECPGGHVFEAIGRIDETTQVCPECGKQAKRIISVGKVNCANEDAGWIKSVCEVVDKEGGVHCQRFLKDPTRKNYKRWMMDEGLRPLEPGEGPKKPPAPDLQKMTKRLLERHRERRRVEVRT